MIKPTFLKEISFIKKASFVQTFIILLLIGLISTYYAKVKALEENTKFLKQHTENLLLFSNDNGRILTLEKRMTEDKVIEAALGEALPRVAYKILSLSTQYRDDGITPSLLLGLIQTESYFNPKAISKAADGKTPVSYGLMQLTRETATFLLEKDGFTWSPETILHPETNLEMGTKYLVMMHRQFVEIGRAHV